MLLCFLSDLWLSWILSFLCKQSGDRQSLLQPRGVEVHFLFPPSLSLQRLLLGQVSRGYQSRQEQINTNNVTGRVAYCEGAHFFPVCSQTLGLSCFTTNLEAGIQCGLHHT